MDNKDSLVFHKELLLKQYNYVVLHHFLSTCCVTCYASVFYFTTKNPQFLGEFSVYHVKWANALLASAILWVLSRFVTADPSFFDAAINSSASLMCIG